MINNLFSGGKMKKGLLIALVLTLLLAAGCGKKAAAPVTAGSSGADSFKVVYRSE
jgi:hypothetical protein